MVHRQPSQTVKAINHSNLISQERLEIKFEWHSLDCLTAPHLVGLTDFIPLGYLHIVEIFGFSKELKTQDLMQALSAFRLVWDPIIFKIFLIKVVLPYTYCISNYWCFKFQTLKPEFYSLYVIVIPSCFIFTFAILSFVQMAQQGLPLKKVEGPRWWKLFWPLKDNNLGEVPWNCTLRDSNVVEGGGEEGGVGSIIKNI